ncbi:MAG: hypothetical protein JW751_22950 [Polyangiaceae bacterium]|nr:hypothetical protein [Polyangiaceae bacterium]
MASVVPERMEKLCEGEVSTVTGFLAPVLVTEQREEAFRHARGGVRNAMQLAF